MGIRDLYQHLRDEGYLIAYAKLLLWRHRQIIAFVGLALALFLALSAVQSHFNAQNRHAIERERSAQLNTCERLQIIRDQANGRAFDDYDTYVGVATRERELAEAGGKGAKIHDESAARFQRKANNITITGPTDCIAATDHPNTYVPPAPEFVNADTKQVHLARKRAMRIVERARRDQPLETPMLGRR